MAKSKSIGRSKKKSEVVKRSVKDPEVAARRTRSVSLVKVDLDPGAEEAVGAIAGRLGLGGGGFDAMAQTWLRGIVDEGYGSTRKGLNRARVVINFLGLLLGGARYREALRGAGLEAWQLNAFRFACPELEKVYAAVVGMQKETMGHAVLDTAYEMATDGFDVFNSHGEVIGRRKSEKMLDRLLVMAGNEFQKGKGMSADEGRRVASAGMTLTFNFGGGNSQSIEVKAPVAAEEVVDV